MNNIIVNNEITQEADAFVYTHEFKFPFEYMGKKYDTLTFDFSKLTGRDALNIENALAQDGKLMLIPILSIDYLVEMSARACGLGSDVFDYMSIADFNIIRRKATDFLE